jgi:hypothetical protein
LQASLWTVPFYDALERLEWVRKKEDILEASDQLVSWSNSLYEGRDKDRTKHQRIIAERLGICERVRMHSIDA